MPAPIAKVINDDSIAYCAEEWGKYEKGRLIYSCFSILVQVSLNSKVKTIWVSSLLLERRRKTAEQKFHPPSNISTNDSTTWCCYWLKEVPIVRTYLQLPLRQ